ncbi:MAG: hypothetical protein ACE5R4_06295 [Armatimonadota bacterium]
MAAVVLALLLPLCAFLIPKQVEAQRGEMRSIAVLPFENKSGAYPGEARGRAAADALALELEATRQFQVTSGDELMAMIRAEGLRLPLDRPDMARVGERLGVEMLGVGIIHSINVMQKQGRASTVIDVQLFDVAVEEYVNGAKVPATTAKRPSLRHVPEDNLIGLAFDQAAKEAVDRIVSQKVPEGTVLIVDDFGKATLSLGTQEGVKEGQVLVTLRPMWVPEREQLLLRKVGTLNVISANPHVATAARRRGQMPKRGDLFRVLYTPKGMKLRAQSKKRQRIGGYLLALAAIAGVALMASGERVGDEPHQAQAYVQQIVDGQTPAILVNLAKTKFEQTTVGYVVHRGTFRNFQPDGAGLSIEAALSGENNRAWSDAPPSDLATQTVTIGPKTFIIGGDETEVSADVDFTHEEPIPDTRYWYRYQTISAPGGVPGQNPPIGGSVRSVRGWFQLHRGQVGAAQITLNDAVASDLSAPFPYGGVTYLEAVDLSDVSAEPAAGDTGVPVDTIDFTFPAAVGADEYQLQVFASPVPNGNPIISRSGIRFATSTHTETVNFSPDLSGLTQHCWRVGAKADNDPTINQDLSSRRGWVYSQSNLFTTVPAPPPPP